MSDHIDLEIADFLADRLPPARHAEMVRHIEECRECFRRLEWARKLREEALTSDALHVTAERVVEISLAGVESATDRERDHLTWCAGCREDLEWADRTRVEEQPGGVAAPAPHRNLWRWVGGLGLAAAVTTAVLVVALLPPGTGHLAELARVEPLPVRLTRAPEADPFQENRFRGLEQYREGDFAGARESLARALELDPAHAETRLYLGSALLLLGQAKSAAEELTRAADAAEGGLVLQESLWQLAQASLAAGDRKGAERTLEKLVAEAGQRDRDAAGQLELLRER